MRRLISRVIMRQMVACSFSAFGSTCVRVAAVVPHHMDWQGAVVISWHTLINKARRNMKK